MRNIHVALLSRVILTDSITFMFQAMFVRSPKFFLTPKSHRHQSRHIKRRACCSNCSDDPQQPSNWKSIRRSRAPKDFIFRPEAAEWNDAADRQPAGEKRQIRVGHVLL